MDTPVPLRDVDGLSSKIAGLSTAAAITTCESSAPMVASHWELVYYASSSYSGVLGSRISSRKFYKEAQFVKLFKNKASLEWSLEI